MNRLEARVLTVLREAEGEPITRRELAGVTGASDRQNRAAIAALINEGHRIESSPRGGYFIPPPEDENTIAQRFIKQGFALVARGRKLLRMSSREVRFKLQIPLFGGKPWSK